MICGHTTIPIVASFIDRIKTRSTEITKDFVLIPILYTGILSVSLPVVCVKALCFKSII